MPLESKPIGGNAAMRLIAMCLMFFVPTIALSEPIETQKIITALTGDWNGDGGTDLALIVQTEPTEPMDMHFFLRDIEHNYLKPVEVVRDQILGEWNGYDRPGYENSDTEPELTALPNNSIRLFLPALPIGSQRTNQTLTIAYRDGAFVVAGFSYDSEDYLKENTKAGCDLNVLTGKGESSKTNENGTTSKLPVSVPGRVIPFANWSFATGLSACQGS